MSISIIFLSQVHLQILKMFAKYINQAPQDEISRGDLKA